MAVIDNSRIRKHALPGLQHQTLSGSRDGLTRMEVWMQTIASGAATPVHRHNCEEALVILKGSGNLELDGKTLSFGPNSTLIVPLDAVHKISNTGRDEMFLVAALSMAPVIVETPDGVRMALPRDQQS